MKRWLICIGLMACGAARSGEGDDSAAREHIKQRRQAVEADYTARQAECRKRFVVTSCQDEARATHQEALRALRQQELALDDAQRRQRAEEQAKRLADKAQKAHDHAELEVKETPRRASSTPTSHLQKPQTDKPQAVDRSAKEQAARERYEARQREIREHREEVEQRNAKRAASNSKPARPLPLPLAASAP